MSVVENTNENVQQVESKTSDKCLTEEKDNKNKKQYCEDYATYISKSETEMASYERPFMWKRDKILPNDTRYETMITGVAFTQAYDFIAQRRYRPHVSRYFVATISAYSNLGWLPQNDTGTDLKEIIKTIKKWAKVKTESKFGGDLELYDLNDDEDEQDDTYMELNERTIQVSLPWKKSWISAFGFKTNKKITFWRGSFENTDRGYNQAQVMKYRMSKRLDLCALAYQKALTNTPIEMNIKLMPIITYTNKNGNSKMGCPEWTFVKDSKK